MVVTEGAALASASFRAKVLESEALLDASGGGNSGSLDDVVTKSRNLESILGLIFRCATPSVTDN